jgi:leucyl aminopeptidase (aminopeptidase T)
MGPVDRLVPVTRRTNLPPMTPAPLQAAELIALVRRVFAPTSDDSRIAILVDLPDAALPDNPDWATRRAMAADWAAQLQAHRDALGLDVDLFVYRNAGTNNADLPPTMQRCAPGAMPADTAALDPAAAIAVADVASRHSILIAPTELSATAPLKLLARTHGFRAATMPGFSASMIPALRLDYGEVRRRVRALKALVDRADRAELTFVVDGRDTHALTLDLRHRTGHASDGVIDVPGTAGNVPSGEAYIVPYEGEIANDPSGTNGTLPVQFGEAVAYFHIERNRAVRVSGDAPAAAEHAAWLEREPAYGNIAELGLGVLAELGVKPVGELLLDEKLGLHVAFGRSDHFGGQVGAAAFSHAGAVVHIDRVYLPELQPRVLPSAVDLVFPDGTRMALMRGGAYVDGVFA